MHTRCIGFCLLGFFLVAIPYGQCYQERLILSRDFGKCALKVEADDQSRVLRLRVQPGEQGCEIEKESVLSALRAAASKTEDPKPEGLYSSLSIGRLIDYPWLSRSLAEKAYSDPTWNKRKGRPQKLDLYKYVCNFLFEDQIATDIGEALGGGYRVVSVMVEKVLVGSFRKVPGYEKDLRPGKMPFDGQVWFRLEKR